MPFLSATWSDLVMVNWAVDPRRIADLAPPGTEIDVWRGRSFLSVVAFAFTQTRVLGVSWPGHRDFAEMNLRFYLRRREGGVWKRAVGFVREIVPLPAVALIADLAFRERYRAAPCLMLGDPGAQRYRVVAAGAWHELGFRAQHGVIDLEPESEEAFIAEHYWGYARLGERSSIEYQVQHPTWQIYRQPEITLSLNCAALYGPRFAWLDHQQPSSRFVAVGSPVTVGLPRLIIG